MMVRSVMVVALVLALAACGRKGVPDQPDGAVYPRDYPYTPMPAEPRKKSPDLNSTVY